MAYKNYCTRASPVHFVLGNSPILTKMQPTIGGLHFTILTARTDTVP